MQAMSGIVSGSGSVEVIASSSDEAAAFVDHINRTDEGTASFELFLDTSGGKKVSFDGVVTSAEMGATTGELEIITVNFVTNGTITTAI